MISLQRLRGYPDLDAFSCNPMDGCRLAPLATGPQVHVPQVSKPAVLFALNRITITMAKF